VYDEQPCEGQIAKSALVAAPLSAALLASPALADEKLKIGLGGFMEEWVGYGGNEQSFLDANVMPISDFDIQSDAEIHFFGKKVLDNGLEVVVLVELEGNSAGAAPMEIDIAYLELTYPSLGLLQIGDTEHSAWQMHNAAPDVGIGNQDGDYPNWVLTPGAFTDGAVTGFNPGAGNATKLAYFSPEIAGFSLGASYASETVGTANARTPFPNASWSLALGYGGEIGGVEVAADVGYGHMNKGTAMNSHTAWQAGLNLGFGGLTVGGSVGIFDESLEGNHVGTFMTGYAADVGASYETGPYAVSVTWLHSEMEGSNATPGDDVKDSFMLSGSMSLGEGVSAIASLLYVDYDDETALAANNNSGIGAVAGIAVEF